MCQPPMNIHRRHGQGFLKVLRTYQPSSQHCCCNEATGDENGSSNETRGTGNEVQVMVRGKV